MTEPTDDEKRLIDIKLEQDSLGLKPWYIKNKPIYEKNISEYDTQFKDLIIKGNNLIPSLDEYISSLKKSDSSRKEGVIARINTEKNLISSYISQMNTINTRLKTTYNKFISSADTAFSSGRDDDAKNAMNDFLNFEQKYGNIPATLDSYSTSLQKSSSSSDDIAKVVWKILPWDLSGKVFKEEDQPEENMKLLFTDPVVILFLIAMVGLAIYYFKGINWDKTYENSQNYQNQNYQNQNYQNQ